MLNGVRHSLRWRLPLIVSALVAVVLAVFLAASGLETRDTLLAAGGARAQAAADQLVSLTSPSTRQRLVEIRRAASDPVLRNYLLRPSGEGRQSVERLLKSLTPTGSQITMLWGHDGATPVVTTSSSPDAEAALGTGTSARTSGLRLTETGAHLVISETTEAIASESSLGRTATLGYLRIRRPALSGSSADTLNRLVGGGAHIELGGDGGWTDLSRLVTGPPIDLGRKGVQEYVAAGGERRLGALAELTGTPWFVWVDFPRAAILAPAAAFLWRMTIVAFAFVIVAGVLSRVVTGRFTRLLSAMRDREHALRALRESEAHYRMIVDVALDCILTINRRGQVVEFNPAAEAMFGYRKADVLGRQISDLVIPPAGREAHRQRMAGYFATGDGIEIGRLIEVTVMHADGREFPVEASVQIVPVHGEPMLTAYMRDISARRQADAARLKTVELEADNRRVREANRLKGAFLANMSHELRTPLNSIIGFSSLLHAGKVDPADERHHEFLGFILTSGQHLLQVINDVLDLSKIEAGKLELHPEPCDLDRVIDGVLSTMQSTTPGPCFVTTVSVDPAIRQAVIDPARLKQVLYNYLSNAFKFTPDGGTIDIRATPDGPDMFLLEVADSGVGILDADLGRLFQDFQQLDNGASKPAGGTGLGLALTRRLVEAQGGSVGVRSTVGKGSVFHARLPRHHLISTAVAPRASGSVGPAVLVIEDDPVDRAHIAEALDHAGYSVVTAATGADAVRQCEARTFDALTLDLLLPDQSGLDVLTQIRASAKRPDVPVVVVTVIAEARMLAGHVVFDILPKPVDAGAILASLRRAGVVTRSPDRILVVDDDESSARLLAVSLESLGYAVEFQTDARAGLASACFSPPSAIVLDLLMPRVDGFQFIDELRGQAANRATPVIVWTVKDLSGDEAQRLGDSAQAVLQKSHGNMNSLIHDLQTVLTPLAAGTR